MRALAPICLSLLLASGTAAAQGVVVCVAGTAAGGRACGTVSCPATMCCTGCGCGRCTRREETRTTGAYACPGTHPVDCGNGKCCGSATRVCCSDGTCCGGATPVCCGDGTCGSSQAACARAECPSTHAVACGDGNCCSSANPICCAGGACCPSSRPVCCGNGKCCDAAHPFCCGNGRCARSLDECGDGCPRGFVKATAATATSQCCPVGASYACNDGSCDNNPNCHGIGMLGTPRPVKKTGSGGGSGSGGGPVTCVGTKTCSGWNAASRCSWRACACATDLFGSCNRGWYETNDGRSYVCSGCTPSCNSAAQAVVSACR